MALEADLLPRAGEDQAAAECPVGAELPTAAADAQAVQAELPKAAESQAVEAELAHTQVPGAELPQVQAALPHAAEE